MLQDENGFIEKGQSAKAGSNTLISNGVPIKNAVRLNARLFEANEESVGGKVKKEGSVLRTLGAKLPRLPNLNCRVETFGRMCDLFDSKREKWVKEIGFGGLLYLRKNICHWLLTRVDPLNAIFHTSDGQRFKLSPIQVGWVLGISKGQNEVPNKPTTLQMKKNIEHLYQKYGNTTSAENNLGDDRRKVKGIQITCGMMARAEGEWEDNEEHEFKLLFLLLAVHLVLCPTQGSFLAIDLEAAVSCVEDAKKLDWCGLVFKKLMQNVTFFAKKFYANGYAGGCGACLIFLAIYYLDRLKMVPKVWCEFPRLKAWSMEEIRSACNADRHSERGDYGLLGCVDVAYGEGHPWDIKARDHEPPSNSEEELEGEPNKNEDSSKFRPRRGVIRKHNSQIQKRIKLQKALNSTDQAS